MYFYLKNKDSLLILFISERSNGSVNARESAREIPREGPRERPRGSPHEDPGRRSHESSSVLPRESPRIITREITSNEQCGITRGDRHGNTRSSERHAQQTFPPPVVHTLSSVCPLCSGPHALSSCESFKGKLYQTCLDVMFQKHIYKNCLVAGKYV